MDVLLQCPEQLQQVAAEELPLRACAGGVAVTCNVEGHCAIALLGYMPGQGRHLRRSAIPPRTRPCGWPVCHSAGTAPDVWRRAVPDPEAGAVSAMPGHRPGATPVSRESG